MRRYSFQELKAIWPYSLGAMPFIGVFIYQIAVALPQRPTIANDARGFIIPIGVARQKTVYMTQFDAVILFGAWLIAAAIIGAGVWRVWRSKRLG